MKKAIIISLLLILGWSSLAIGDSAIELLDSKWAYGHSLNYIVGTVKNNTGREYRYVCITFIVYDKDWNQVGTAMDTCVEFQPYGKWKFTAHVYDKLAVHYRFSKVTYF